jgi:hypothetical protein
MLLRNTPRLFGDALCLLILVALPAPVLAQSGAWGYAVEAGLQTGTADDSEFVLGFRPDYYLSSAFSFGGLIEITPTGDLTQVTLAATANFHFDMETFRLSPFVGVGGVWADLESERVDESDSSYVVPLGVALEVPFDRQLSFGASAAVNLTDLDFGPRGGEESSYFTLVALVRFRP